MVHAHIGLDLYLTKYVVFVTNSRSWQIQQFIYQIIGNILGKINILNISAIRARVAVMHLMAQSCLHVVNNFLRPPEPDVNMLCLSPYHRPVLNSAKFHKNVEIWTISVTRLKITRSAENCTPQSWYVTCTTTTTKYQWRWHWNYVVNPWKKLWSIGIIFMEKTICMDMLYNNYRVTCATCCMYYF